jgi:TonB family protein
MNTEHVSSFTLDLLHLDALTGDERERVKQHLAGCVRCRLDLEAARSGREQFARGPLARGLFGLAQRRRRRRLWLVLSPALALAALLLILRLASPGQPRGDQGPPAAQPQEVTQPTALDSGPVKSLPVIDGDACSQAIQYTGEAVQLGIEGQVALRIELDEKGGLRSIRVLEGLGHGLDENVVNAFKTMKECRFTPAYGPDGKPMPYAFTYRFTFELPGSVALSAQLRCPASVPDARVRAIDVAGGVDATITASDADGVAEIRKRSRVLADAVGSGSAATMDMDGCVAYAPNARLTLSEIPSGVRLSWRTEDVADVQKLQAELKRRMHAPEVIPGTPEVRGYFDKKVIRNVVRRHLNEVKSCYAQELMKKADLSGRVMIQFTISGTGQVMFSVVQESNLNNPSVELCIAGAVRRWEFPEPRGGGMIIVSYPFVLQATGAE